MCDLCNRPALTVEDHLEQVRTRLTRERFMVQSVAGSACRAEFSYSVGLTGHGLPELIVTGARRADAARLVDLWGAYMLDESLVLSGETLQSGPFVMEAVAVECPQDHLLLATAAYGDTVRAGPTGAAVLRGPPAGPPRRAAAPVTRPRTRHCTGPARPRPEAEALRLLDTSAPPGVELHVIAAVGGVRTAEPSVRAAAITHRVLPTSQHDRDRRRGRQILSEGRPRLTVSTRGPHGGPEAPLWSWA
ncbi:MAG: DUF4262 domain-containing protein [Actinomycetota bacterium]|nr:DUF4262 domain-containing protein [Actinomycetota bacterium]